MQVEQIDREAAASGYFAWCSGNPVIPDRMIAGTADDHSMVQALARHRLSGDTAGYARAVGDIVAWLRENDVYGEWREGAATIEAKFGKRTD